MDEDIILFNMPGNSPNISTSRNGHLTDNIANEQPSTGISNHSGTVNLRIQTVQEILAAAGDPNAKRTPLQIRNRWCGGQPPEERYKQQHVGAMIHPQAIFAPEFLMQDELAKFEWLGSKGWSCDEIFAAQCLWGSLTLRSLNQVRLELVEKLSSSSSPRNSGPTGSCLEENDNREEVVDKTLKTKTAVMRDSYVKGKSNGGALTNAFSHAGKTSASAHILEVNDKPKEVDDLMPRKQVAATTDADKNGKSCTDGQGGLPRRPMPDVHGRGRCNDNNISTAGSSCRQATSLGLYARPMPNQISSDTMLVGNRAVMSATELHMLGMGHFRAPDWPSALGGFSRVPGDLSLPSLFPYGTGDTTGMTTTTPMQLDTNPPSCFLNQAQQLHVSGVPRPVPWYDSPASNPACAVGFQPETTQPYASIVSSSQLMPGPYDPGMGFAVAAKNLQTSGAMFQYGAVQPPSRTPQAFRWTGQPNDRQTASGLAFENSSKRMLHVDAEMEYSLPYHYELRGVAPSAPYFANGSYNPGAHNQYEPCYNVEF